MSWMKHDPEMMEMASMPWDRAELLMDIRQAQRLWKRAKDEGVEGDAFYDLEVFLYRIEEKVRRL